MDTAVAPGFDIHSGGEDYVPVFADFGAIPGAVLDAASEPFTQRVMELAISSAECADAFVATDMDVPGPALKMGKASGRLNTCRKGRERIHFNGCSAHKMDEFLPSRRHYAYHG